MVCWLDWNISAAIGRIAPEFCIDTHVPEKIKPTDFGDPQFYPLVPASGLGLFRFQLVCLSNYWMDCDKCLYSHSWCSEDDPLTFPFVDVDPWGWGHAWWNQGFRLQIKFSPAWENAALLNEASPAAQQGSQCTGPRQGNVKYFFKCKDDITCSTCYYPPMHTLKTIITQYWIIGWMDYFFSAFTTRFQWFPQTATIITSPQSRRPKSLCYFPMGCNESCFSSVRSHPRHVPREPPGCGGVNGSLTLVPVQFLFTSLQTCV